jgi:hypothetical protein
MGYSNNLNSWNFNDFIDKRYIIVHHDDVPAVKDIQPNMTQGPWIAGGAVLNWYKNSPVGDSDIDVFFHDLRQFDEVFGRLMRQHATMVYNSDNAITLNYNGKDSVKGHRIQLIRKRWFSNPKEVIDNFDFTICQLITDGEKIAMGPTTAEDIKHSLIKHTEKEMQPDLVKRIIKYVCYGYSLDTALANYIEENKESLTWKFNADHDHYENAF